MEVRPSLGDQSGNFLVVICSHLAGWHGYPSQLCPLQPVDMLKCQQASGGHIGSAEMDEAEWNRPGRDQGGVYSWDSHIIHTWAA